MVVALLCSEKNFRQFLEDNSIRELPGLNVQEPWCSLISCQKKTIETRTYPCPESKLDIPIALIATQRGNGLPSAISCIVKIVRSFKYDSQKTFSRDRNLHLVEHGSLFDWNSPRGKWGWKLEVLARFETPFLTVKRKGIVWARDIMSAEKIR